ncbi:MAG: MtrB/PioB family outer membrane beta-barrel protein [Thermodesulfovibrionales bacterium]
MKKILILLFSVLVILNSSVFAEETETTGTEAEIYHFPEIKPEFYGFMGYRLVSPGGSEKAGEFEYLHSSPVIGGEIRAFPFPHRLHLEADVLNKKDYFIDMDYAYKDLVLFRGINRTLFHNLDNISLIDLNPATTSPRVAVRDSGEKYGVDGGLSNLFLRFKTPDFPFHVYLDGRFLNKNGDMQQRFMGGAGYFTGTAPAVVRVSQKKHVDWSMKDITIGANSHAGPVEIDISHGEKRFDSDGDRISSESYVRATSSPVRAAGTYPHNLVPDLKSSTNTLKLHTSYTGRLVASATISQTDKKNRDSGAKADYFAGAAEVTYIPYNRMTIVARYKHREADLENPSSLPAGYLGYSAYTTSATGIRPSLSSQTDTLSGLVRYRPFTRLGLNAGYTYEQTERKNDDVWKMTGKTTRRDVTLSANARLMKKLTLKAKYEHRDIHNPAHNTQPNRSNYAGASLSWTPLNWASAMLSYNAVKEKRHDIHYVTSSGAFSAVKAENRTAFRNRVLGSVTFMLFKRLSVTPSYAYMHNRIVQDLAYNDTAGNPQLDRSVPYKDTANSYALSLNYAPKKNLDINAEASQTKGRGSFYPGISNATLPVSVASFSELKVKETVYAFGSEYRFKGDWAVGLKYRYNNFKDMIDNPYDDAKNGIARIILLTISKKW